MLARIGVGSIEELLDSVPESLREAAALKLPPAPAVPTVLRHLRGRAARNHPATEGAHFLGAGAYAHDIPAAVDALAARSEFATAYTPYQAEVAQGTLQAIFEFQTLVCQLTGLDVANASMYDGASATAEAALMALRTTRRRRLCVSAGLHPHYRQVLDTCTRGVGASIDTLPLDAHGRTPSEAVPEDAAALLIQSPNFFGCVEDLAPHAAAAGDSGALLIAATTEALALALLRPPGEFGADVACGEAQSFGVPLSFGGPFVGYLASRNKHLRQLPGRLIGETVDVDVSEWPVERPI